MKNIYSNLIYLVFMFCAIHDISAQCNIGKELIDERIIVIEELIELTKFVEAKTEVDQLIVDMQACPEADLAAVQVRQAYTTYRTRDLESAQSIVTESISYYEDNADTLSNAYARALSVLGEIMFGKQLYEQSKPILFKAKNIYEQNDNINSIEYAVCLESLAKCHYYLGDRKAIPFITESAKLIKEIKGPDHIRYGIVKINQGAANLVFGLIDESTHAYEISEKIFKNQLGEGHVYYGIVVGNLAANYSVIGDLDNAVNFAAKSVRIIEKNYGRESMYYINSLLNYIEFLSQNEENERALECAQEGRVIADKIKNEAPFATMAFNSVYARILFKNHRYEEAKKVIHETLDFGREYELANNAQYIDNKKQLGELYFVEHAYDEAKKWLNEAVQEQKEIYGEYYVYLLGALPLMAHIASEDSDEFKAQSIIREVYNIINEHIDLSFGYLSEREKEGFINTTIVTPISKCFNIPRSTTCSFTNELYDMILLTKGVQLESSMNTISYAIGQNDSMALDNYYSLLDLKKEFAAILSLPLAEQEGKDKLKKDIEILEKSIARLSQGWDKSYLQVSSDQVVSALSDEEVAIEFFHYQEPYGAKKVKYVALILRSGSTQPVVIDLFNEDILKDFLADERNRKEDYVKNLYSSLDRGLSATEKVINLYDLIWKPIEDHLTGVNTVYYSASGLLNRVNITAIAIDEFESILDYYDMIQVSSTRSLAHEVERATIDDIYIVGGVDYGVTDISTSDDIGEALEQSRAELMGWQPIRWTTKESKNIISLADEVGIKYQYVSEQKATEADFKQIGTTAASPSVIHLATHGFFYPDPKNMDYTDYDLAFKTSENPLMRSGLIMANGNDTWMGRATNNNEDGILTAYEISNMNLLNTELVVLSACESGLGDIRGAEGVYGLQRAFKKAGVDKIIMSLWQVPDRETSVFMTTFYENWLTEGLSIRAAFNKTQKEMRDRFFNPYDWAGFVLIE